MKPLYLESVGLYATGFTGWKNGRAILAGEQRYIPEPMPKPVVTLLPANERRRTTTTVKLALQVAQDAMGQVDIDPQSICAILASSGGDSDVVHNICMALLEPDRPVSPTQFHHSVHNTPAGYWAIATNCTLPSISLSAYNSSFTTGLREAVTLALAEMTRVLLIAYDLPLPFPLSEHRIMTEPFAVALLLNPVATEKRLAMLRLNQNKIGSADILNDIKLEKLRLGNPAARCLPLLQAIARQKTQSVILDAGENAMLNVEIEA